MNTIRFKEIKKLEGYLTGFNHSPVTYKVEQKAYGRRFAKINAGGQVVGSLFSLSQLIKDVARAAQLFESFDITDEETVIVLDAIELTERLELANDPDAGKKLQIIHEVMEKIFGFKKHRQKLMSAIDREVAEARLDHQTLVNTKANRAFYSQKPKTNHLATAVKIFNLHYGSSRADAEESKSASVHWNPHLATFSNS